MLVRADPQFLRAGARLDVLERGDHAGLEDVEPAGDVKAGDVDRAAEIVPGAERVRRRMGDDLVEKRLPGREIRITGQRQVHPVRRVDKRRVLQTRGVEPAVALCRRDRRPLEFGGADSQTAPCTASRCDADRPGMFFATHSHSRSISIAWPS